MLPGLVEVAEGRGCWPPSLPASQNDSGEFEPDPELPADDPADPVEPDFSFWWPSFLWLSTALNTSLAQWSCPTEAETPTGTTPAAGWAAVASLVTEAGEAVASTTWLNLEKRLDEVGVAIALRSFQAFKPFVVVLLTSHC